MTNLKDILRDMALEVQKNEHSFDEPDGEPGRNIEEIVDEYLEAVVIRLIGYEV